MFHFVKNFPDVKTDDAQTDHEHTADEQQKDDDRRNTRRSLVDIINIQGTDGQDDGDKQQDQSVERHDLQRFTGKRNDVGKSVTDQRIVRPFCGAGNPFRHIEFDFFSPETHKTADAAEKQGSFLELQDIINDLSVNQLEIGSVPDVLLMRIKKLKAR